MGFADPTFFDPPSGFYTSTTTTSAYEQRRAPAVTTWRAVALDFPRDPNAMPRGAQLAEIGRLSTLGRRHISPREGARLGWHDAPRRPCYRAVRAR